ncbi:MAG: glucose-6-phosphate dehydrogenase, partial [Ilumatobacter sp.]|nr:glucose-6-phosphate dehydrogenase [Ilumatobacter sp.]
MSHHHHHGTPDADALVMLGLAGDLGEQKLFPALVQLASAGLLGIPVVAVGRSERSDDDLREMMRDATGDDIPEIDLIYVQGDATDVATFDAVAERLGDDVELPVVYASLPPHTFGGVAEAVAASGLPDTTRVVLEKPFGENADDARRLHEAVITAIDDDRLFVVDHFLAKSSVENLLTFRSANPMIDALMCSHHVERIEITMSEEFGVDGRESFYDDVGAVADVVQNHLLQLIAVLTMEPPTDDSEEAFDRSRAALLDAITPLAPDDVVLGQFDGYTDHDDIDDDSRTETFAAARLSIDNDRWRDT